MLRVASFLVVVAMGLALVGCGAQPGKSLVKYTRDSPLPNMTKAPRDGTYSLYSTWDATPIVSYPLMKDDALGFKEGDNGGAVAVAGNNTYPVKANWAKGTYYWKVQK
jgi:hypothetical protein